MGRLGWDFDTLSQIELYDLPEFQVSSSYGWAARSVLGKEKKKIIAI